MFSSAVQKSIISDENFYLGYTYLKTNDFRFDPEQPPLIKELTALPLLFLNLKLTLADEWDEGNEWAFSRRFLFEDNNDKVDLMVMLARLPVMLLALLLGFFIYLFARKLYGIKSGLFALFLYSFSPNILAHARLATVDFGLVCFSFISMYFFWRLLGKFDYKNLILFSLFFAFAQMSKHSALFLFVIIIFILLFKIIKTNYKIDYQRSTFFFVVFILINFFVLLASYGFNLNDLYNVEERVKLVSQIIYNENVASVIYPFVSIIPIPTQYIVGLNEVIRHSKTGHKSYLMGKHSMQGWWYYFPVAFLVKVPIAIMLFIVLSLIFFRRVSYGWFTESFLLSFIIIYFIFFMFNNINIGLRHILPIFPFFFVFVSKIVNYKKLKWLIGVLSLWYIISSIMIFPHYLSYFNEFVGPNNGHEYLIDSNLDWGQDVKGLAGWMDNNGVDSLKVRLFGTEDLDWRGINHEQLPCFTDGRISSSLIAISVNELFDEFNYGCFDYLLEKEPIDKIGYSIWIFDIKE
jgi:hypothetical protein